MHDNTGKFDLHSDQNVLPLNVATPWQKLPVSVMLPRKVLNGKQAQ